MAIQSSSPASAADASIIENEFPAYRAISRMAVFSLLLGLLSILCFADDWFLVAAAAAVVTGALATRKISRLPDVLTGRGLAQAGIALGLIFGLASVTVQQVQGFIRTREARKFGEEYISVLKSGSVSHSVWYRMTPAGRKIVTPEKALDELEQSGRKDPERMMQQTTPVREIIKRLNSSPSETLTVEGIEKQGLERLDSYAFVLLRLTGPGNPEQKIPAHDENAMMVIKGKPEGNGYEWWIEELIYPYTPKSHTLKPKPVDDGHGHAGPH